MVPITAAVPHKFGGDGHPLPVTEASGPHHPIGRLEEQYSLARQELGPEHRETIRKQTTLARALRAADNFDGAVNHFRAINVAMAAKHGADHRTTLQAESRLANCLYAGGDFGQAAALFLDLLERRERVLGHDHPDTLRSRSSLANSYMATGQYGAAAPLHREAFQARERLLGANHPRTLASRRRMEEAESKSQITPGSI